MSFTSGAIARACGYRPESAAELIAVGPVRPAPGCVHIYPGRTVDLASGERDGDRRGTLDGADPALRSPSRRRPAGEIQRTTTTGQLAWPTRCWLTDPSRMPRKPPCPRDPTTTRSASPDRSMSTSAGFLPSTTEVRTSTAGVLGTSWEVNCSRRANASFLGWLS